MQFAWTSSQSRAAEESAVAAGIPLAELMERAGRALVREVTALAPSGRVLVLAGPGNNGGDGWIAARLLAAQGRDVTVLTTVDPKDLPRPAADAAASAIEASRASVARMGDLLGLERELAQAAVVVDALLGVGLHGPLRDPYQAIVEAVNDAGVPVVAADVPTGVDADTGAWLPEAIRADVTVTFGAPKSGLLQFPAAGAVGVLSVADIGIAPYAGGSGVEVWEADDLAEVVPVPAPDAHKGSRGRLLVVAGSTGMSGAAVLAAGSAQRAGAGYVTLAVPHSLVPIADAAVTSVVVVGLAESAAGTLAAESAAEVLALASRADAVVLGPGLGRSETTVRAVRDIVAGLARPLLLDADGLYAVAEEQELLVAREAPTIVTPHSGEAGSLLGRSAEAVQQDRYAAARDLAKSGVVAVLKGARTVIDSGARTAVNMTGGPALATAGTGDVLAGVIGALLAQGVEAYAAAVLGVYLHGRAGDIAEREIGPFGVVAGDLASRLPRAVAELLDRR
jgi:NAD(P)H-hydrate epimerase